MNLLSVINLVVTLPTKIQTSEYVVKAISVGENMLVLNFSKESNGDCIALLPRYAGLRYEITWCQHQSKASRISFSVLYGNA